MGLIQRFREWRIRRTCDTRGHQLYTRDEWRFDLTTGGELPEIRCERVFGCRRCGWRNVQPNPDAPKPLWWRWVQLSECGKRQLAEIRGEQPDCPEYQQVDFSPRFPVEVE